MSTLDLAAWIGRTAPSPPKLGMTDPLPQGHWHDRYIPTQRCYFDTAP